METAISYLKKSVKYKDDVAQTHLLLGQCYQNLNKKDDGVREYKRTLQIDLGMNRRKKVWKIYCLIIIDFLFVNKTIETTKYSLHTVLIERNRDEE